MAEFTMPKLGHLMEEGTVVSWKKAVGDPVVKGEILLDVEMDKATAEVESNLTGTLKKIMVQENQTVPVGEPLAIIE